MLNPSVADPMSTALKQEWEAAWQILFTRLDAVQPAQLLPPVAIRGEAFQSLSIPRGRSEQFNQPMTGSR